MQLFDDARSRSEALAGFVRQGLQAGHRLLVVACWQHLDGAAACLARQGWRLDEEIARGRVSVHDAAELLDSLIRGGLQQGVFDATVGTPVRRLVASGSRLRVYGEMVDLLALEGNFSAVTRLERLWNELLLQETVDLMCAYSSQAFGHPAAAGPLQRICRAHSHLRLSPRDPLGAYLLEGSTGGSPAHV